MVMKHINIVISGKVHGVFFRAAALDKARELGLRGFVRNDADGSVYAEAEGDSQLLDQFVAWCHRGPDRARVDKVSVTEGEWQEFEGFQVRR